ncbi:polysaccharide deacetylase family sporulation protein PdaB [Desulfotomaculum arcticum]|uniref:Polysaccharide deacetylase family sporulation protein PdaB n=1 Tax=Desulfotruncus arcticus DSM 17038 TaxID=1121424 RepID=A0A1I2ZBS4_9FIRM|nr:polysaccharide deacetylase family sporulation protein PdaB [Desulfotruncus arcticus]SFH35293.1 polysaccharide deacetylase family sporulation protein PdaB [Desulfotomaculum arcticum] [Desulfotruncus arcticus DSM 17038]
MRVFLLDYKKIKRNFLLGALLLTTVILFFVIIQQKAVNVDTDPKPHAIYKVATKKPVVALTFDISWGTKVPGPVLDILKEKQVKSTFFLSGPWVKQHPEFPKRIAAEGHELASHGNEHVNYSEHDQEWIKTDILAAQESIKEVTGVTPNLIRTPNGDWNDNVLKVITGMNYKVIQWSDDSLDWKKDRSVKQIIDRVLQKVHPGAIILMHASDTCDRTPEALPAVIDGLRQQGYNLVTVSELLDYGPGVID